jgi:acetyltransferase
MAAAFHQRRPDEAITNIPPGLSNVPREEKLTGIISGLSGALDEQISKQILSAYGIPTVPEEAAADLAACEGALSRLGFPVVMKGLQQGVVHKTELGLVRLGINDRETARQTFAAFLEKMKGNGRVLIQKQAEGKLELILGLLRDPQFGPCVMVGLGGILAEAASDVAFLMAPLTKGEALKAIGRLKGQKLLDGFRSAPPVDKEKLAELLIAVGQLGLDHPRIQEIDINPLIVGSKGLVAVDATVILK